MNKLFSILRRTFFAGLLAAVPVALTVYILTLIFNLADKPIARLLRRFGLEIPGLGLILMLVLILLLGFFVTNVLGRRLFSWGERLLVALPIVNPIYNTIKQITNAFSGASSRAFRKVVYLEYPRRDLWTIAFVTAESTNAEGRKFYHLFVPTTPNPTSGYYLICPQEDVIESHMKVEDGLKTVISGGALANPVIRLPAPSVPEPPAESNR